MEPDPPTHPEPMHGTRALTQRLSADPRMALLAGRMFVLQVAHPAVGAGVAQHSAFRTDPWTRLRAIQRSAQQFLWSGPEAARAEGERLRRAHRDIHGVDGNGRRYHALEPRAYGWVHMVFLDTSLTMSALYGPPLSRADEAQLFAEWYQGGLLLGLRPRDLPRDLADYRARWSAAVDDELEPNAVVAQLLERDHVPPPPPWAARLPRAAWSALWRPLGISQRWLTIATLPPRYRARLPVAWTAADERRFARVRAAVRALGSITGGGAHLRPATSPSPRRSTR